MGDTSPNCLRKRSGGLSTARNRSHATEGFFHGKLAGWMRIQLNNILQQHIACPGNAANVVTNFRRLSHHSQQTQPNPGRHDDPNRIMIVVLQSKQFGLVANMVSDATAQIPRYCP